jgi:hypothetical protein
MCRKIRGKNINAGINRFGEGFVFLGGEVGTLD